MESSLALKGHILYNGAGHLCTWGHGRDAHTSSVCDSRGPEATQTCIECRTDGPVVVRPLDTSGRDGILYGSEMNELRAPVTTWKKPQHTKHENASTSKTLVWEHNLFWKHACNPRHLYIKANFKNHSLSCDHVTFSTTLLVL